MRKAALYARISSDREGQGLGVDRQLADCREHCQSAGYEIVHEFSDNDVSAWKSKTRPGYAALLDAIRLAEVDVVVCWHTDRLTRSILDLEELIEACQLHDIRIEAVKAGLLDLSTAAGQLNARLLGAVARHESDQKAERIRRKHQELAHAGKPASLAGSYGYTKDGNVDPEQAAVIKEAASRLLAGESLRSLTAWLNDSGVPTARGGRWTPTTLRQILTSARISGQREWTPRTPPREERRGWDGRPQRGGGMGKIVAVGDWEAIITPEQTLAIRRLVSAPERKQTRRRHYLLSAGILKCGLCGFGMNHKTEHKNSRYACIKTGGRGCGRMSISCPAVEELVTEALLLALSRISTVPDEGAKATETEAVRAELQVLQERLVQIGLDFSDGIIKSRAEWLAMRDRVQSRIDEAEKKLEGNRPPALRDALTGIEDLRAAWPDLSLDRRRAILSVVIDSVVINPSDKPKGYNKFDPDRVEILWRH